MPSKIILKKSSVATKAPVAGDLDFGELAINYTDSKLYFKKADGSIDAFAASAPVTSVGGNVGDITNAQLLTSIKNVDGANSGLDADFLDGLNASAFYLASNPNGYTNNTGTVTSVATSGTVSGLTLTGGTITTSGTITLGGTLSVTPSNFASQTAGTVLAAPSGVAGVPTFRALVAADIPILNQNTTGTASNVTGTVALAKGGSGQTTAQLAMNAFAGAVTSASYLRGNGTNVVMSAIQAADVPTLNQNTTGTASNVTGTVAIANGGTGATTAAAARTNLGATTLGSNLFTLTNVAAISFPRINANNTISSLDAATFRTAIGAGTSSTTGTVTSVGGTGTVSGLTLSGTVTSTGNLTLGGTLAVTASNFASQTANTVLAAPNGVAGVPTFRALVAADIPILNQNTTGSASLIAGLSIQNLYNNMGQNHNLRTSFDASIPSYNFGYRFVQGSTNGPGTGGSQYYSWYIGLGNEYPATGTDSYGAMFAVDRNVTTPYLSVRYNENNSFSGWRKIAAGLADRANSVNPLNVYTAVLFNSTSDEILKTNWRNLPGNFVDLLALVKSGTYDRIDQELTQDGVSAQSLQPLLPNSVFTGEDGNLSIAYGNAALVSAVELAKRVVEQDARIAKLEERLSKLLDAYHI